MHNKKILALTLAVVCCPMLAMSQDVRSIIETMQEKQIERMEGVDLYVVSKTTMGQSIETWFERREITNEAGEAQTVFMPVHPYQSLSSGCQADTMTAEQLDASAGAMEMFGDAAATEIEDGLEAAGLPRGLLAATGTDPTATFNPRVMMGSNAMFMRAAANAKREMAAHDPAAEAMSQAAEMDQFLDTAELVGTEEIDGHTAYHLMASNVDVVQQDGGNEYRMDNVSMYIDTDQHVPLLMKIDGTMTTSSGDGQAMTIENIQTDYRQVPDTKMYEPYRSVMRIAGVMDEKQQAEIAEAQEKMAEFEQQMAAMPASQRKMMEQMMGPQLEMMRKMVAGNAFELETVTSSITINPDTAEVVCP